MSLLEEMFDPEQNVLNERPYTRTQGALDSAAGKVKGMFGGGQIEQGAQATGAKANQFWNQFKRYIGQKYGKSVQAVTYQDASNFFKGNGLDPKFLGTNTNMSFTPKDVGEAILSATRELMDTYAQNSDDSQEAPVNNTDNSNQPQQSEPENDSNPTNNGQSTGVLSQLSPQDRQKLINLLSVS